jgi:hypothetical protein
MGLDNPSLNRHTHDNQDFDAEGFPACAQFGHSQLEIEPK